jgi:hypothetical protein
MPLFSGISVIQKKRQKKTVKMKKHAFPKSQNIPAIIASKNH